MITFDSKAIAAAIAHGAQAAADWTTQVAEIQTDLIVMAYTMTTGEPEHDGKAQTYLNAFPPYIRTKMRRFMRDYLTVEDGDKRAWSQEFLTATEAKTVPSWDVWKKPSAPRVKASKCTLHPVELMQGILDDLEADKLGFKASVLKAARPDLIELMQQFVDDATQIMADSRKPADAQPEADAKPELKVAS